MSSTERREAVMWIASLRGGLPGFVVVLIAVASHVASATGSPFQGAAIACEWVELKGSGIIGSFDSLEGPFDWGAPGENAGIWALGTSEPSGDEDDLQPGDVNINTAASIYGTVTASRNVYLENTADISGSIRANETVVFDNGAEVFGDVVAGDDVEFNNTEARIRGELRLGGGVIRGHDKGGVDHVGGTEGRPEDGELPVETEACDPMGIDGLIEPWIEDDAPSFISGSWPKVWRRLTPEGAFYRSHAGGEWIPDPSVDIQEQQVLGRDVWMMSVEDFGTSQSGGLIIEGGADIVVVVDEDFEMAGNTELVIAENSSLTVFVKGRTHLGASGSMPTRTLNAAGDLPSFSMYSSFDQSTDPDSEAGMILDGNSSIAAAVYAPGSDVVVSGSGVLYGAVRGRTVTVRGHGDVIYDEALADLDLGCTACTHGPGWAGANLTGFAYHDADRSGDLGEEETWTDSDSSVALELVDVANDGETVIAAATADAGTAGAFEFTGIDNGTYLLRIANADDLAAAGWVPATPQEIEVNVEGEHIAGLDFGFLRGVTVSGVVYHDEDANGRWSDGEDWADGPIVAVRLFTADGVPQDVAMVTTDDGHFSFRGVSPGSYRIAVNAVERWIHLAPSDGSLEAQVDDTDVTNIRFGLFHGSRVTGSVFRDDGASVSIPNDGIRGADERGWSDVIVEASDGATDGAVRRTRTSADGGFELYLPGDWADPIVRHERRPATGVSLRDSEDGTAEVLWGATAFDDPAAAEWALDDGEGGRTGWTSGRTYALDFGAVDRSSFGPDQSGQATTPGAVTYVHRVRPGTLGTLELIAGGSRTYRFRVDGTCAPGETTTASDGAITLEVTRDWPRMPNGAFASCPVEVRVLVPAGEPSGRIDIATLTASLAWSGAVGVVDASSAVDVTTIVDRQGLSLEMTVDDGSGAATRGEGRPADVLEYCVRYGNVGVRELEDVAIHLPIPFHTQLERTAYPSGGDLFWSHADAPAVALSREDDEDEANVDGHLATLRLPDPLEPSQNGSLCLKARIR